MLGSHRARSEEQGSVRHDPAFEQRAKARKLRILRMQLRDAIAAADELRAEPTFARQLRCVMIDVESALAREEAELSR